MLHDKIWALDHCFGPKIKLGYSATANMYKINQAHMETGYYT